MRMCIVSMSTRGEGGRYPGRGPSPLPSLRRDVRLDGRLFWCDSGAGSSASYSRPGSGSFLSCISPTSALSGPQGESTAQRS